MSADGSITLPWGGEERKFRLGLGELRELQEKVNHNRLNPIGPRALLSLFETFDAWPDQVREVLRLGLIGGGTKIELVPGLIKRYCDERPPFDSVPVAHAVLMTALMGVRDDPVGKKPETEQPISARSDFPSSTAPEPQSDLALDKLTNAPSGNSPQPSRDGTEQTAAASSSPSQ